MGGGTNFVLCDMKPGGGGGFKLGQSKAGGEQQKRKKEGGVAFPHIPVIFWCGSSSGV